MRYFKKDGISELNSENSQPFGNNLKVQEQIQTDKTPSTDSSDDTKRINRNV